MEDEKIHVLVEQLAILLAWRDKAQNRANEKASFEYEHELMEKIRSIKSE